MLQNAELSTLAEYFNKEDTLDYTKGAEDVHLPGDLYGLQKKGAHATCALSMMHRTIRDIEHVLPLFLAHTAAEPSSCMTHACKHAMHSSCRGNLPGNTLRHRCNAGRNCLSWEHPPEAICLQSFKQGLLLAGQASNGGDVNLYDFRE